MTSPQSRQKNKIKIKKRKKKKVRVGMVVAVAVDAAAGAGVGVLECVHLTITEKKVKQKSVQMADALFIGRTLCP